MSKRYLPDTLYPRSEGVLLINHYEVVRALAVMYNRTINMELFSCAMSGHLCTAVIEALGG